MDPPFQPSLFDVGATSLDERFSSLQRHALDDVSWVDYAPGWVGGSTALFDEVRQAREWGQFTRWMYDRRVKEPRLTSHWRRDSGEPLQPAWAERMRWVLSARYRVDFDSVGFNFYRDGDDSVAWHSDRILKSVVNPVVALVSLGAPRKFMLRPVTGGKSRSFMLGHGDLLVTGGQTQARWHHSVPKVAHAFPRISLAFRHGLDPAAYSHKTLGNPAG